MKKFYHATTNEKVAIILKEGLRADLNIEGIVYLCEKPEDAAKFLMVRGYKDFVVLECELDESELEEQFDHSQSFFRCRCWGLPRNVKPNEFTMKAWQYEHSYQVWFCKLISAYRLT